MSAIRRALPAPHERVYVAAREYGWGVLVEYMANSIEELVAAGAAPPIAAKDRRQKFDVNGDSFTVKKKPLKSAPNRVLLVRWIRKGNARALPGVRECLEAQDQPATSNRSEWMESVLRNAAGAFGDQPLRAKCKTVGRFQRPVDYATAGALIIPDWVRIQALVTVNRVRS